MPVCCAAVLRWVVSCALLFYGAVLCIWCAFPGVLCCAVLRWVARCRRCAVCSRARGRSSTTCSTTSTRCATRAGAPSSTAPRASRAPAPSRSRGACSITVRRRSRILAVAHTHLRLTCSPACTHSRAFCLYFPHRLHISPYAYTRCHTAHASLLFTTSRARPAGWSYEQALAKLRTVRGVASPNTGFMVQLMEWHDRRTQPHRT